MTTRLGPSADVQAIIRLARSQGRAVHIVEAGRDKATSLEAFAASLDLPDWFGYNLDALMDALRDFAETDGRPITLIWDRADRLREHDPRTYHAIVSILDDIEMERRDVSATIVVR